MSSPSREAARRSRLAEVNSARTAATESRNPMGFGFIVELLRSINHYYAYAAKADET